MNKKLIKKRLDQFMIVFLILYFASYVLLSAFGSYDSRPDRSGKTKLFEWGWSVPDIQIWQPKFLMLRSNNWNYGGLAYVPLIWLDRKVWHRNLPY